METRTALLAFAIAFSLTLGLLLGVQEKPVALAPPEQGAGAPFSVPTAAESLNMAAAPGVDVTVYNQGFGFVKDRRELTLSEGINQIEWPGVASGIEASSVHLDGASVLEQDYRYDVASQQKLLEKYLNMTITVETEKSTFTGRLVSYANGIVLETSSGVVSISDPKNIIYPSLPEGLLTKPTLVWEVIASKSGKQTLEASYLTAGMSWSADYIAIVGDNSLDLNGWATVGNGAGITFSNARLTLVAGDVNRVQRGGGYVPTPVMAIAEKSASAEGIAPQFVEAALSEYHSYTLQGVTTLRDNEQKQISLLTAKSVPASKEYVFEAESYYYWGGSGSTKVKSVMVFNNSGAGLGIPLPAGNVKAYQRGSDGSLQFVGEDSIDHTPAGKEVRAFLGYVFDITGQRTTSDVKEIGNCRQYTYNVTIKNSKTTAATVSVIEKVWAGVQDIIQTSMPYEKVDAYTIKYRLQVPAGAERSAAYTVQYCT